MKTLPIGLTHSCTITVDESLLVPQLPSALPHMADMPPVQEKARS